ncbi:preprotein translocase subunit TatA [Neoasaia chiangmaiensis]|uniref:Sec-independent protein translocase protein TatA n=2 Tax=Neoasaia chiangmaiensis TaxID=320497 RepID=A0A1U9KQ60_9PROT|nr:preprotein translocase subunit TatA [Neoasaia chiangmaiensis]
MSPLHWMVVLAVVLVLFGGGSKISGLMGDFAKGIKSFKKNMADDESLENGNHAAPPNGQIPAPNPHGYTQAPSYTAPNTTPSGQPRS